jgi:hypothetical protein
VLTSGRASLEHPAECDGDARDLARSPVASG